MESTGATPDEPAGNSADSSGSAIEVAPASGAGGGEVTAYGDLEAHSIVGDIIASEDMGGDLADLHAVLASLSNDTLAYLDVALDHLTSSSDLFDVPAMDVGDMPDDFSAG